jgi:hypothetical protein
MSRSGFAKWPAGRVAQAARPDAVERLFLCVVLSFWRDRKKGAGAEAIGCPASA